jgi:hypothetical protein
VGFILFSGCIGEEKTNSKSLTSPESSNKTSKETSALPSISIPSPPDNNSGAPNSGASVPEISQPEMKPGEFDINISSYYFVYLRDNLIYENNTTVIPTFDLVEKNYVIYHLAIKNNYTETINFSINKLQLHTENQVFTPADPGTFPQDIPCLSCTWVFQEIKNENGLNDTLLYPDQILEGIVIFQLDNYTTLFDRSFSLSYNTTPITSTSYEKSLEALAVAENFDYSIAFGMPPYDIHRGTYSYNPPESEEDPYVWANWVNRTVFESYKKYDEMSLPLQKPESIPYVDIAYAVKVIPAQDLTIYQNKSGSNYWDGEKKYTRNQMYVVDDTGEELFNKSIDPQDEYTGLVILDNQTYRTISGNMPRMFIPQATIVHFSFNSMYGWSMAMRLSVNNQDIILDEQHNITLGRYDFYKFIS